MFYLSRNTAVASNKGQCKGPDTVWTNLALPTPLAAASFEGAAPICGLVVDGALAAWSCSSRRSSFDRAADKRAHFGKTKTSAIQPLVLRVSMRLKFYFDAFPVEDGRIMPTRRENAIRVFTDIF
jgi:hypothetical protein